MSLAFGTGNNLPFAAPRGSNASMFTRSPSPLVAGLSSNPRTFAARSLTVAMPRSASPMQPNARRMSAGMPRMQQQQQQQQLAAYPANATAESSVHNRGAAPQSSGAQDFPLVSLGCSCGPKLALREMGRDAETLPFDWMCTTIEGIIGLLTTDFQGFFEFSSRESAQLPGATFPITVFRSTHHSWWHDDPTDPATREKFNRRIQRLNALRADNQPILFVRVAASTDELPMAGNLSRQLIEKFGPRAMLLVIVGGQRPEAVGPYLVQGMANLLVHFIHAGGGQDMYCAPISVGLDWLASRQLNCPSMDLLAVHRLAIPSHSGFFGMGGIPAFDNLPPNIPAPGRVDGKPSNVGVSNGSASNAAVIDGNTIAARAQSRNAPCPPQRHEDDPISSIPLGEGAFKFSNAGPPPTLGTAAEMKQGAQDWPRRIPSANPRALQGSPLLVHRTLDRPTIGAMGACFGAGQVVQVPSVASSSAQCNNGAGDDQFRDLTGGLRRSLAPQRSVQRPSLATDSAPFQAEAPGDLFRQMLGASVMRPRPTLLGQPQVFPSRGLEAPKSLNQLSGQEPSPYDEVPQLIPLISPGTAPAPMPQAMRQLSSQTPLLDGSIAPCSVLSTPVASSGKPPVLDFAPAKSPSVRGLAEPSKPPTLAPSVSASPGDGGGLDVGDPVDIWSKTSNTWCQGKIDRKDTAMIFVHYRNPNGEIMSKGVPYGHPWLRRAQISV